MDLPSQELNRTPTADKRKKTLAAMKSHTHYKHQQQTQKHHSNISTRINNIMFIVVYIYNVFAIISGSAWPKITEVRGPQKVRGRNRSCSDFSLSPQWGEAQQRELE